MLMTLGSVQAFTHAISSHPWTQRIQTHIFNLAGLKPRAELQNQHTELSQNLYKGHSVGTVSKDCTQQHKALSGTLTPVGILCLCKGYVAQCTILLAGAASA